MKTSDFIYFRKINDKGYRIYRRFCSKCGILFKTIYKHSDLCIDCYSLTYTNISNLRLIHDVIKNHKGLYISPDLLPLNIRKQR
jgi:protein-arginine kinase activator protein McsA